ncbi:PPOX class F420-dependent oxidoreductase [Agromyces sp. MMS24-JH15]|uniref:PPOX class F420-dependent oxidoreductase n=1 Tax=Agromyces sp. MMS24-JH15 TaxID=3243765 RepID=UPI00374A54F5
MSDETTTIDRAERAPLTPDALLDLFSRSTLGILATIKKDGRPQLSNVGYHFDPETRVARIIAAGFRAKTRNLSRDPRASIHVSNKGFSQWLVGEGIAEISEPCVTHEDVIAEEILALPGFDHFAPGPERDAFLAEYPIIGRHIIRVRVDRVYGGESSAALGISFNLEEVNA